MIQLSVRQCQPLEEVRVRCDAGRLIRVWDGAGRLYEAGKGPSFAFRASGALGAHVVSVHDEAGVELERATFAVDCRTAIDDEGGRFRRLLYMVEHTLASQTSAKHVVGDGERVYRLHSITSRDTIHALKGAVYFAAQARDVIDLHAAQQREDGMVWDFSMPVPRDVPYHFEWRWGEQFSKRINRDQVIFARQPVMNDLEHMYIGGVYLSWQATGDDDWMAGKLDSALAAMRFARTSPYTWSEKYQLIRRPYCIDLWDYQSDYDAARVDGDIMDAKPGVTVYGIFHGDNTGMADACRKLSILLDRVSRHEEAAEAREFSEHLLRQLETVAWNGEFYTHHVSEDPSFRRDFGVDEAQQVSLSNAYAVNRGIGHEKVAAIVRTYQRLREEMPATSPAEWFGIYPPFPKGWHVPEWTYTNGAVTTMTAGELAHGAFEHGFEAYGADVLARCLELYWPIGDTFVPGLRGKMPEPPERSFTPLDLRPVANADLVCTPEHDGWTGDPGNDLRELPVGAREFEGVPFDVIEPPTNDGRACIRLARGREGWAEQARIPVEGRFETLYLLHAAGGKGDVVGELRLVYEDGSAHEQYILNNRHVAGFWNPQAPDQTRQATRDTAVGWCGGNERFWRVGLIAHGLANPHPDRKVSHVELRASREKAAWLVVALTTSDAAPFFMPEPTDGGVPPAWGAGAVMYALAEGLAGIHDADRNMQAIRLTPRWSAAGVEQVTVALRYVEGGGYVRYTFAQLPGELRLDLAASGDQRRIELLLPEGAEPARVRRDGVEVPFELGTIETSRYVCLNVDGLAATALQVELA